MENEDRIFSCGECVLFGQTAETRKLNDYLSNESLPLSSELIAIAAKHSIVAEKMRESREAFEDYEFFAGITGCVLGYNRLRLNLAACVSNEEFFSLKSIGLDTL